MKENVTVEEKEKIVSYIIQSIGINDTMKNFEVPENLIEQNIDNIDWELVSTQKELSIEFLKKWSVNLNWSILSYNITNEEVINEFSDFIEWNNLPIFNYSDDFVTKWYENLNWDKISLLDTISEEFISKWSEYINWEYISCNRIKYTNDFLVKFKDRLDWDIVQILIDINEYEDSLEEILDKIDLDKINTKTTSLELRLKIEGMKINSDL